MVRPKWIEVTQRKLQTYLKASERIQLGYRPSPSSSVVEYLRNENHASSKKMNCKL